MKEESVNTGSGTTAPLDTISLPAPIEPTLTRQPSRLSRGRSRKKTFATSGLSCLDSVDLILIERDQNLVGCGLNKGYRVKDVKGNRILLKGEQDSSIFNLDGLKNVIVRDTENLSIARICFKQKSSLYPSMALAVYAPCDVLVGSGEERSGYFMFTSKLLIRNSDGDQIFIIEYFNNLLSSYYKIKSSADEWDTVAKIKEKTRSKIRLQFTCQMNAFSKLILVGYCIALVNKFTPPNKSID